MNRASIPSPAKRNRQTCRTTALFGLFLTATVGCRTADRVPDVPVALPTAPSTRVMPVVATSATCAALGVTLRALNNEATSRVSRAPTADDEPSAAHSVAPPPYAEYAIDLQSGLGLAGAENPTIALAAEAVQASLAEQLQARALLLPTLNAGGNYRNHQGHLQGSTGLIRTVDSQSLYFGAGARSLAAESVAFPGVRVFAHLADAFYEPHAAAHRVVGRRLDAQAVRNDVLLQVVTRYFDLVGAEARLLALRESESDFRAVAEQTAAFARADQGRQSDADRARADLLLLLADLQRGQEEAEAAAAELARLLDFDPAVRLRPPTGLVPLFKLVDPRAGLEELVRTAVRSRPEVGARSADVAFAQVRLREEKARPLLPLLSAGFSAGEFGGGSNLTDTRFGHFAGRTDADLFAIWSLRNFGLGDVAVRRERQAEVGQAEAELAQAIDRVRQEVAEAHSLAADRRGEVDAARSRLASASAAYRADVTRAKNLEGRPIEVLNSASLLRSSREDYIRAVVGYDQAEFRLFVALGQPPTAAPNDE